MERTYFVRGRQIVVEEVDEVWAIRLDENQDPAQFVQPTDGTVMDEYLSQQVVISAFREAKWHFIRPSDALLSRFSAREPVPGIIDVGKVVVYQQSTIWVVPFRLNVKLLPQYSSVDCQGILDDNELDMRFQLRSAPNLFHVESRGRDDAIAVSDRLRNDDDFLFAEPSLIEHIAGRYAPPGEPEYPKQWQWNNTGQLIGLYYGTPGADVSAEAAWDETFGKDITVAVIDKGFDVTHPDLQGGISDASGFFNASGGFQKGLNAIPAGGHGTQCAAMAGARENGKGGVGGAPQCNLLLIALGEDVLEQARLARAVEYAINPTREGGDASKRADILSVSAGPHSGDWTLSEALENALTFADTGRDGLGTPIFWSATNKNVDSASDEVISHANVIAVVKSDNRDLKSGGSVGKGAYGKAIELTAPGRDVWLPDANGGYSTADGTSMATPCAAAGAALALSVGNSLTREELRQILRETADKIGTTPYTNGRNDEFGYGRINYAAAVERARFKHLSNFSGKKLGCAVFGVLAAALIIYLIMMA